MKQSGTGRSTSLVHLLLGLCLSKLFGLLLTGHALDQLIITVKGIELVFLLVETRESGIDDDTTNERGNGQTNKHPHDGRVISSGRQSLSNSRAESIGQQIHGLHEGLHVGRRLRVSIFKTSDGRENFRNTNEDVCWGLNTNVDIVRAIEELAINHAISRGLIAGTSSINEMLNNRSICHGNGGDDKAKTDSGDRTNLYSHLEKGGIEYLLHDWNEDNDGDGVEVLHKIVGDTVSLHLRSLCDKVAGELAIHNPVDGINGENLATNKSTLDLVDEMIIPRNCGLPANRSKVGRLGGIGRAGLDHHENALESIGDNGALWRADDIKLATKDKNDGADDEDTQTHQIGRPETNIALHIRSSEQRKRTNVDASIKDHIDTLDGDGGIDDDTLALLVTANSHPAATILIGNQGRNVGLDTTSANTNDNDSDDETA